MGCGLIFGKETLTKLTWSHSESGFVHVSELQRKFSYLLAVCVCSCTLGSSLLVCLKPYVTLHVVAVSCRLIIRLDYFVFLRLERCTGMFREQTISSDVCVFQCVCVWVCVSVCVSVYLLYVHGISAVLQ